MKRISLSILIVIIMIFSLSAAASASGDSNLTPRSSLLQQEVRGSIRGVVYEDRNADGVCVGTGEPTLAGINVQFVSDDGGSTVHLQSGPDGSYGLVSVGLGTWTVTAVPLTGFSVSSINPLVAVLNAEQPETIGLDFCIIKGSGTDGGSVVLPESGASVAPPLVAAGVAGFILIASGATIEIRRRRSN